MPDTASQMCMPPTLFWALRGARAWETGGGLLVSCLADKAQVLGSGMVNDFWPLGMCSGITLGHKNSYGHMNTYALINQPLEQSVFKKRKQRKAYIYKPELCLRYWVTTAWQVNCSIQGYQKGNLRIISKARTLDKDSLRSGHFRRHSILGHFHVTA